MKDLDFDLEEYVKDGSYKIVDFENKVNDGYSLIASFYDIESAREYVEFKNSKGFIYDIAIPEYLEREENENE